MDSLIQHQFTLRAPTFERSASWIADPGLLEAHAAACELGPDATLLDVCCGTGIVGASFRGKVGRLVGVDLTQSMLDQAGQKLDEVRKGSVYALPFEDGTFDGAVIREALHLMDSPALAAAQIFRVLKPGGQVIVGHAVPFGAEDTAWMRDVFLTKQPLARFFYTEQNLRDMLEWVGFRDVKVTDHPLWESIDLWVDTDETPTPAREKIRRLFQEIPAEAARIHPIEIRPDGEVRDCWRWIILSARKPKE